MKLRARSIEKGISNPSFLPALIGTQNMPSVHRHEYVMYAEASDDSGSVAQRGASPTSPAPALLSRLLV